MLTTFYNFGIALPVLKRGPCRAETINKNGILLPTEITYLLPLQYYKLYSNCSIYNVLHCIVFLLPSLETVQIPLETTRIRICTYFIFRSSMKLVQIIRFSNESRSYSHLWWATKKAESIFVIYKKENFDLYTYMWQCFLGFVTIFRFPYNAPTTIICLYYRKASLILGKGITWWKSLSYSLF